MTGMSNIGGGGVGGKETGPSLVSYQAPLELGRSSRGDTWSLEGPAP